MADERRHRVAVFGEAQIMAVTMPRSATTFDSAER